MSSKQVTKKIGKWIGFIFLLGVVASGALATNTIWSWFHASPEQVSINPTKTLHVEPTATAIPKKVNPLETEVSSLKALPTQLDYELIGTFVSPNSTERFARIKSPGKEIDRYVVGDLLDNRHPITLIEREFVEFMNQDNHHLEFIKLRDLSAGASRNAISTPPPPFGIHETEKSVFRVDSREWHDHYDFFNSNPFFNAHLTPYLDEGSGRVQGYTIKLTNPNSIWHGLGIQSGDLLMKVDGETVDNSDALSNAFQHITDKKQFTLQIRRDDKTQTLTIKAD